MWLHVSVQHDQYTIDTIRSTFAHRSSLQPGTQRCHNSTRTGQSFKPIHRGHIKTYYMISSFFLKPCKSAIARKAFRSVLHNWNHNHTYSALFYFCLFEMVLNYGAFISGIAMFSSPPSSWSSRTVTPCLVIHFHRADARPFALDEKNLRTVQAILPVSPHCQLARSWCYN